MTDEPVLTAVREGHRFNEAALSAYLGKQLHKEIGGLKVRQFEGGQSNPTFLLEAEAGCWVLRKKPPGKLLPSAHAVEREYRVMRALRGSAVPVPKMELLCDDETVIGTPFFLMEHVPGRVVADPSLPGMSAAERTTLYHHFSEILAALHGLDYKGLGLEDFGRAGNYYSRQIARWSGQYRASMTEPIEAMDFLMEWLPGNLPKVEETCLVHGDFRLGNCILHPERPRIAAVVDWELSTLGEPLADVAYACLPYYYQFGKGEVRFPQNESGIPTVAAFLDGYRERTGNDPRPHWTFCVVFTLFRLAAIVQGVVKRGLQGNASSAEWSLLSRECRNMAERAMRLVETGL